MTSTDARTTTVPRVHAGRGHAATGHAVAALWFAAIAAGLTAPLWRGPSSIIGSGLGDNAAFVWNFWWAKLALHDPARSLFATDLLFAPLGTSLVLHTGTPLLTMLSALWLPGLEPVDAYNLWITLGLFLNGLCAYLAAYELTGRRDAALLAGTIFAAAPFLVVRANGHLNVLNAWGLPLLVFLSERLQRRPTILRAAVTGIVLGAIALIDYYYFIFAAVLAGIRYLTSHWRVEVVSTPLTAWRRRSVQVVLAAMLVAVVLAVAISVSGGWDMFIGATRVRMRGTFNLRVIVGLLAVVTALVYFGPRVRVERRSRDSESAGPRRDTPDTPFTQSTQATQATQYTRYRHVGVVLIVTLLVVLPLMIGGARVWMSGDYVAPKRFWRSAPAGLDAGTLLLGNPTSVFFGDYLSAIYQFLDIDETESIGWLGLIPSALLIVACLRLRRDDEVRRWLIALAVFGIWSLGPYLMVLGTNTGLMLPQTALRFIPVLNNARMPGRAYAVVILAVAMIAALVLARSKGWLGRRWWAGWLLAALTLVDYWPRPFEMTRLDHSTIYDALARAPNGVVLELPIGLRDGFGERGRLDHWSLYHQTLHGHPLVGGFVARLSARIVDDYTTDAVFAPLLDLSEGLRDTDRRALGAPADTLACSIRYVVLPSDLDTQTLTFVRSVFRLQPMAETTGRSLYTVTGFQAPYCDTRANNVRHSTPTAGID